MSKHSHRGSLNSAAYRQAKRPDTISGRLLEGECHSAWSSRYSQHSEPNSVDLLRRSATDPSHTNVVCRTERAPARDDAHRQQGISFVQPVHLHLPWAAPGRPAERKGMQPVLRSSRSATAHRQDNGWK